MGTDWILRRKPLRRPKKTPGERRQRERVQRKRLVAMGMDQAALKSVSGCKLRALLKRQTELKQRASGKK